jgi:hypothetical protein
MHRTISSQLSLAEIKLRRESERKKKEQEFQKIQKQQKHEEKHDVEKRVIKKLTENTVASSGGSTISFIRMVLSK